ncbi:MAG: phosphoglucosamine mutase [Chloroflexi bacterium]|nr:phosphoglucosamine mutase [Chloroflexota bacterium]
MSRLFGTDGVRGVVGEWPLVPEFALALGRAAGSVLAAHSKQPTILVGRDTRQSGPMLQSALVAGLLAGGVDVLELDVITTPGISWLTHKLGARAGVVISASHNPVQQNGIKFFGPEGHKLPEALEEEIERIADPQPEDTIPNTTRPKIRPGRIMDGHGMRELYIEGLLAEHHDLQLDRLTVVLDCANGAASEYAPEIFARAGVNVVAIHASPTGLNINVDAGSENVRQWPGKMKNLIQSYHANFGVAFDGDADRVIFVDQNGGVVDGDHMLGMLARYFDKRDQLLGRSLVTTTMRNAGLKKFAEAAGWQLHETPVGDKYVTEKLIELRRNTPQSGGIGLGGEQSGHVILLDDSHVTGDGMRTALFVMRAFIESGATSMAEFAAGIGKTPQVIASADVGRGPRLDKFALVDIENQTLAGHPGLTRINLRYSGTESKFRAMLESDGQQSEEALAGIAARICRQIQAASGMNGGGIEIQDCSRGGLLMTTD